MSLAKVDIDTRIRQLQQQILADLEELNCLNRPVLTDAERATIAASLRKVAVASGRALADARLIATCREMAS